MKRGADLWSKEELYTLPAWQLKVVHLVQSKMFDIAVAGVILMAAVVAGVRQTERARKDKSFLDALVVLDDLILLVFVAEVAVRIASVWPFWRRYFQEPWNVFDFTIVVFGLLEVVIRLAGEFPGSMALATLTRVVRLFRVLRLFRVFKELQLIVKSLARTLYSLGWIFLVLMIIFYLYAVIGVAFFHDNDPFYFEDVAIALITLFRVATGDSWTGVLYVSQYGCDRFGELTPPDCDPQARPFFAPLYFVSFIILATFVVFNLFVGIVMMHMLEVRPDEAEEEASGKDALLSRIDEVNEMLSELQNDLKRLE